ncbi:DNA methyltransferase [Streptomyces sp. CAU 1734]|uniref:DNA methyltransferase n=1 Tax=Streptomyces sp. CAU 1734 TaxID=3140360 RepID=UPI003260B1FB
MGEQTVFHRADGVTLYAADCMDVLPTLPDASVTAVVTDPPYELRFMGNAWDSTGIAYDPRVWAQCLRVLTPGGHLAAFGAARTYHRMTVAIEDAGFEIRDGLMWLYGGGFPKSVDVSRAIDKRAGARRAQVPTAGGLHRNRTLNAPGAGWAKLGAAEPEMDGPDPVTGDAARWQGWGTALKPGHEPIVLARKPFPGAVAATVLEHGTGALNVDACRVGTESRVLAAGQGHAPGGVGLNMSVQGRPGRAEAKTVTGRWPPNVVLSHSPLLDEWGDPVGDACAAGCVPGCPVAALDGQSSARPAGGEPRVIVNQASGADRAGNRGAAWGTESRPAGSVTGVDRRDGGGPSRFFPNFRYEGKAPARERPRLPDGTAHPTVKPLELMRWLVRLIAPPGGTVLDPFAGSGTTLQACLSEGFDVIGIERHGPFADLCRVRLERPIAPVIGGT